MLFILGILAGFALAVQSAVNARLREHLGAAFLTSFVSFVVGFLCLLGVAILSGSPLIFPRETLVDIPFWSWLGGWLGMMSLTVTVFIFPALGGVQASVMAILGQIFMGIFIDHFGWFHAPKIPFSTARGIGMILVLMGVIITVILPNLKDFKKSKDALKLWFWRVLGIFGGTTMSAQAAINGGLGQALHAPFTAALVSFFMGSAGLLLAILFYEKSLLNLKKSPKGKPVWIWTGGILAGFFITSSIWLVPQIGTAAVIMLMLSGLIVGSLFIDHFGLLGVAKKRIIPIQILGTITLLAGVAFIRLF